MPISPDIDSILARAAQRKRRRQISVTAASVVVVGGLGFSSAQLLSGSSDTSISAGVPDLGIAIPATTTPERVAPLETTSSGSGDTPRDEQAGEWSAALSPSTAALSTTSVEGANQAVEASRRVELADTIGGAVIVTDGRLMHRMASGETLPLDLPEAGVTTERRVADLAMLDDRPFLLISDFTDRPDLAAAAGDDSGTDEAADSESDSMHQDLAIYAVDLSTNDVHIVEARTVTDRQSPDWVYNGHITAQGNQILVVRELWQSMCVYVETLDLDGNNLETPENPLPEPSLFGLSSETITAMQAGVIDPPRGCIAAGELPDGVMTVLGIHADPAALELVNNQLRSAASLTAKALSE